MVLGFYNICTETSFHILSNNFGEEYQIILIYLCQKVEKKSVDKKLIKLAKIWSKDRSLLSNVGILFKIILLY
jgi:hypothetical protein